MISGSGFLVVGWGSVAERGVPPVSVVQADDGVGDVGNGLGGVGVVALPDPLHFQVKKTVSFILADRSVHLRPHFVADFYGPLRPRCDGVDRLK